MKMRAIRTEAKARSRGKAVIAVFTIFVKPDLNPIVILTNVDRLCGLTEDDTSKVFHSKEIDHKVSKNCITKTIPYLLYQVKEISTIFGFTLGQIFPVCSYSVETECDDDKDYLTLLAMRQILRYSGDYLKDKVGVV